jgi:hypothetical protein
MMPNLSSLRYSECYIAFCPARPRSWARAGNGAQPRRDLLHRAVPASSNAEFDFVLLPHMRLDAERVSIVTFGVTIRIGRSKHHSEARTAARTSCASGQQYVYLCPLLSTKLQ